MPLPLPLRNRLADLVLDALHDTEARAGLEALAAVCADPRALAGARRLPPRFPADLFETRDGGLRVRRAYLAHAGELGARARRAWQVVRGQPLGAPDPGLPETLRAAARLFDGGLYFEVHEALEGHWFRAEGAEREALQGLIQVAVGFQHLANGNVAGARLLLREGATRLAATGLAGLGAGPFAAGVLGCAARLDVLGGEAAARFDWAGVPRFPPGDDPA